MQEGSPVTNSDVDTQLIHDLVQGQSDLDRWSGKDILTTLWFLTTYSHVPHMDIQPSCPSVNADTIESFPVESPVFYEDIQDGTITPRDRRSMEPTALDAVLNCDCHVLVRCDGHFRISLAHICLS